MSVVRWFDRLTNRGEVERFLLKFSKWRYEAIVSVALYGMPYQIIRIMEIAERYGIPVIEDAAEGFGSRSPES